MQSGRISRDEGMSRDDGYEFNFGQLTHALNLRELLETDQLYAANADRDGDRRACLLGAKKR